MNQEAKTTTMVPRADVLEGEGELLILCDVPGAGKDDVSVKVERGVLQLAAEAKGTSTRWERAFALPRIVDVERVSAELDRGVLRVHLPKVEQAKPRQIPVAIA
jgi:HSP20 family molecular chaperone IbpA